MPLLVFWPRTGAFGAGAILELCAQLVWCELYVMKKLQKQKQKKTAHLEPSASHPAHVKRGVWPRGEQKNSQKAVALGEVDGPNLDL